MKKIILGFFMGYGVLALFRDLFIYPFHRQLVWVMLILWFGIWLAYYLIPDPPKAKRIWPPE